MIDLRGVCFAPRSRWGCSAWGNAQDVLASPSPPMACQTATPCHQFYGRRISGCSNPSMEPVVRSTVKFSSSRMSLYSAVFQHYAVVDVDTFLGFTKIRSTKTFAKRQRSHLRALLNLLPLLRCCCYLTSPLRWCKCAGAASGGGDLYFGQQSSQADSVVCVGVASMLRI